jgi:hypothetical protein
VKTSSLRECEHQVPCLPDKFFHVWDHTREFSAWLLRDSRVQREEAMNYSMYSAGRGTHLKIVVVGLLCATLVAMVGVFSHVSDLDLGTAPLFKAGQPTVMSGRLPTVR